MRKLTSKKIKWIIKQLDKETPVKEIAAVMRITPRRIYQLKKQYEETGEIPELKRPGRKPKPINRETEEIVLQAYQKYKLSPILLEKLIKGITEPNLLQQRIERRPSTGSKSS